MAGCARRAWPRRASASGGKTFGKAGAAERTAQVQRGLHRKNSGQGNGPAGPNANRHIEARQSHRTAQPAPKPSCSGSTGHRAAMGGPKVSPTKALAVQAAACDTRDHALQRLPACQHASLSEPESPQTCNACQPVTPASLHARNPAKSPGARRPPTPAISQPRQPADPTSPSAKADHLRSPPERGPKDPLRDPGMRSATHATRHRPPAGPRGPGTHEAGRGSMHTPDTPPSASAPSPRQ